MTATTCHYRSHKARSVSLSARPAHIDRGDTSTENNDVAKRRRVVGYCRVSTDQQADFGVSLDAQQKDIRNYCLREDLELVDIVIDGGQSGKNMDRPGLKKVIALLEAKRAYGVVVTKLDRLSRNIVDICNLVDTYFAKQEYALHSVSEKIDTKSTAGKLVLYVMSILAQIQREDIVERCTAGVREYMAQGGKVGSAPYGWRYSERLDAHGHRVLEEVPEQQAALKRMLELLEQGCSLVQIRDAMIQGGYPTKNGGQWDRSTVYVILERLGKVTRKKRRAEPESLDEDVAARRALELRAEGTSLPKIAKELNSNGLYTPNRSRAWNASAVADLIDRATMRDRSTAYGLAFQLRSQGLSYRDIAKRLLAEGFKPTRGQMWHAASVYYLLTTRKAA